MSVFVDTGVFYAHHDENSPRHGSASVAMEAVLDGEFGQLLTSDYVYDESVTLALSRFEDSAMARAVGNRILGRDGFPDAVDVLFVGRETFEAGIETSERFDDQGLSFTDATTISLVDRHDIDHVLAFDDDFDGVVSRLDPAALYSSTTSISSRSHSIAASTSPASVPVTFTRPGSRPFTG